MEEQITPLARHTQCKLAVVIAIFVHLVDEAVFDKDDRKRFLQSLVERYGMGGVGRGRMVRLVEKMGSLDVSSVKDVEKLLAWIRSREENGKSDGGEVILSQLAKFEGVIWTLKYSWR